MEYRGRLTRVWPRFTRVGWNAIAVGGLASIVSFAFFGQTTPPTPASQFASASVGIGLTNGTLQATNLLPGVQTNTIPLTLVNTGNQSENFDLQFTGVTDTLNAFGDLGQLEFLVTTPKGTITYSLDPGSSSSLGLSSPLTLSLLESITLPIAQGVAPSHHVSIPLAVELASGEGFGNAWNGKAATISYRIVATPSAVPVSKAQHVTVPFEVTPSTSAKTGPVPVRLVTGPPQAPLDNRRDVELGGGLMGLGLAGIGVIEVSKRSKKRRAAQ